MPLNIFLSNGYKELKFNFKKMGYNGNSQPTQIDIPVPIMQDIHFIFVHNFTGIKLQALYVQIQKPKSLLSYYGKSFQNLRIASPHNRYPDKSEQ